MPSRARTTVAIGGYFAAPLPVAFVVAIAIACSPATRQDSTQQATRLPGACSEANTPESIRCGKLSVLENRAKPEGRRIELNVVVIKPATLAVQLDPVFFIAGGPSSPITAVAPDFAKYFTTRDRDLVLVDQRGTKGSAFLYCQELDEPADVLMPRFHMPAVESCRDRLAQQADLTQYQRLPPSRI
jgi:pimeloyl-ACP methyl ester carboxylesterase